MRGVSQLEVGDILAYKPKEDDWLGKAIAKLSSNGKYSHVSIYAGQGMIYEANTEGVVHKRLNPKWFKSIDAYRTKKKLSSHQKSMGRKWLKSKLGCPYEWGEYPSTFIKSVIGNILRIPFLKQYRPIFNNPNKFVCSELVTTYYQVGMNVDISNGVHYMSTNPNFVINNDKLYKCA